MSTLVLLRSSSSLAWRCVMISRRRVLVFGVGGLIVAMVTPFWRKFACEHSSDSSSSPIVFKFGMEVRYGKSKTPIGFWCGRSHRCHGNPIFCGNFLVSALAAVVFLRSSSNLAWRCIMGRRSGLLFLVWVESLLPW